MRKASAALSTVDMNLPLWIGEHLLTPCSEGGRGKRPFRRPNAGVAQEDERHGCRERRVRPWMACRAGLRSDAGVRAPRQSRGRMQGQAFLVSFLATEKRNSPGKAKQVTSIELDNQQHAFGHSFSDGALPRHLSTAPRQWPLLRPASATRSPARAAAREAAPPAGNSAPTPESPPPPATHASAHSRARRRSAGRSSPPRSAPLDWS